MARIAVFLILLAAWASPDDLRAQADPIPTTSYALTNARIVVGPGQVIDRGTVIIENGRIAQVGAGVTAPAGMVSMDLAGQSVYPGMVDAASSLGLTTGGGGRGGRGGGGGRGSTTPAAPPAPEDAPPQLRPFADASDYFGATDAARDDVREAGFTTLGLAFQGGLFPGRVAAISLGDGDGSTLALNSPVALQVHTGSVPGRYPGTLMGALAYIEQSWEDTKYDIRVREAFAADPSSAPRPRFDREHEALEPAVTGELPVWFAAESQNDYGRMADLAERLGIVDYLFVGGQEGYLAADVIAALGKPVIVSLDYPNPDQVTGRAFANHVAPISGEDSVDEQEDQIVARALRANAATLAEAGVTIALSPRGADPAEFRSLVRGAIEEGLSADDALRAVTVTPAALLGIEGAVGTIEAGKLANLIVTDGDLFGAGTRVLHAFVEGTRYSYEGTEDNQEGVQR